MFAVEGVYYVVQFTLCFHSFPNAVFAPNSMSAHAALIFSKIEISESYKITLLVVTVLVFV